MTNKKPFVKRVLHGIELPFHQNLIFRLSPTAALEQSLRATWDAASGAAILILSQVKLNSQLSSRTSFFKLTEYGDHEGTQSGLPSFNWTPFLRLDSLPLIGLHEEPELWYQQWPLAPIDLLRECRQIWVSLSWFLNLLYWLRFWVLLDSGAGYLPPPRRNDTGVRGARWNIQGIPTQGLDTE